MYSIFYIQFPLCQRDLSLRAYGPLNDLTDFFPLKTKILFTVISKKKLKKKNNDKNDTTVINNDNFINEQLSRSLKKPSIRSPPVTSTTKKHLM